MFFGPTEIFTPIFKNALTYKVELKLTYHKDLFHIEKEPIFSSILQTMVLGLAVNLKKKARIQIKDSCVLIGVVDERGILEENEVFVKISRGSY